MKDYFLKLFRYDLYANLQLLNSIFKADQPQNAVRLMAHLLVAQQTWLSRCNNTPAPDTPLWPNWQALQFKHIIEENYNAWIAFIVKLEDDDLTRQSTYATLKVNSSKTAWLIYLHI